MDEGGPRTRVTTQLRELRFDAGSPALDLVATVGRRPSAWIERLGDPGRLRAWAEGAGFPLAERDLTGETLDDLRGLREAIFTVVTNVLAGEPVERTAAGLVNDCAAIRTAAPRLVLAPGGRLAGAPPRWSPPELKAALARDAISLVTDPARRARLRRCDSPICRMIFLDSPGGRPRRWCSMRRCGNSSKAAAYRRRGENGENAAARG